MITIESESFMRSLNDLVPLMEQQWVEVSLFKDLEFNPNFAQYFNLEDNDMLITVVARDNDQPVGYIIDVVAENIHYSVPFSVNDIVFIDKAYRSKGLYKQMTDLVERIAIDKGAQARSVAFELLPDPNKMKNGYQCVENLYIKRLGEQI